jgi:hypothetical protein
MTKKSSSQSAFFNVRVLIGLFIFMAGAFLALLSFGTFSSVFAQANGTKPNRQAVLPRNDALGNALSSGGGTREEMAAGLAQALNIINPPACVAGSEMFPDVPASSPFCPFIEELSRRGITGGCGGGNFCPGDPVTRQQMAVFLVKILGSDLSRAHAMINRDATVSDEYLKGVWTVRRPAAEPTGVYCLTAEGFDRTINPAIVTIEWGQSSGSDLLAYWRRSALDCDAGEYEVRTYNFPGGVATLTNNIEFLITLP